MYKVVCPYKPCGSDSNCLGCMYDPEERPIKSEMFMDMCCHLGCGDCKHCNPKGDMDSVESPCRRIDHKHFQFAVPWFKSYDCGQQNGIVCRDFEPNEWSLWLFRHWNSAYLDEIYNRINDDKCIGLCIDKDQSIRYYVRQKDFFNNTFKNKDGSLKWIYKMYYKRSKESATGYKLVKEYNSNIKID